MYWRKKILSRKRDPANVALASWRVKEEDEEMNGRRKVRTGTSPSRLCDSSGRSGRETSPPTICGKLITSLFKLWIVPMGFSPFRLSC